MFSLLARPAAGNGRQIPFVSGLRKTFPPGLSRVTRRLVRMDGECTQSAMTLTISRPDQA